MSNRRTAAGAGYMLLAACVAAACTSAPANRSERLDLTPAASTTSTSGAETAAETLDPEGIPLAIVAAGPDLPPFGDRAHPVPATLASCYREALEIEVLAPLPAPPQGLDIGTVQAWTERALTDFVRQRQMLMMQAERRLNAFAEEQVPPAYFGVAAAISGWIYDRFVTDMAIASSRAVPASLREDDELLTIYMNAVDSAVRPMLEQAATRFAFCEERIPADADGFVAGFRAYCVERGAVLRGTPERTLTTAMVRMRLAAWDPGPAPSAIVAPSAIAPLEAFRLPASLRAPHAAALEAVVAGAQARAAGTDASWTPYLAATDGDALASWPEPLRENLGELARLLREAESDATPSVLSDFFLALYEDSLELPRGSGCAMARAFAAGMLIAEHDRLLGREREIARSLARREASLTMHAESQRALARSVEHQSGDDLVAGAYRLSANDGTFPDEILAPLRSAIDAYVGATDDDGPERDALRAAVASLVEAPVGAGAEVVDERADFVEAAARVRRLYVALGQNGVAGVRRASRAEERDNPAEEELDWARFLEVCR